MKDRKEAPRLDIKLDDIELVKRVQPSPAGPYSEIRSVSTVDIDDRRDIVEIRIPGAEGGTLQDMGRGAIRIRVVGEVWGKSAKDTLESLKDKSEGGDAVSFTSDLLSAAKVSNVIIERLLIDQSAGVPDRYKYTLFLREYKGETEDEGAEGAEDEEEEAPPDQTEEAEEEAEKETEVDDIHGQILDAEGNPAPNVAVKIVGPDGERVVLTDEDGNYQVLDAPDGEYTVSVDQQGYEKETKVTVKKGGGEAGAGGAP
jgi:hypothetical protein